MWLINTDTFELEEFLVCPEDQYAILSHRWDSEELNFDEFRTGGGRDKKGFWKIQKCCQQAASKELQYVWVDTCCIDKRSSAELSEAINSMFQWYRKSKICYVYMSDLVRTAPDSIHQFVSSQWFTRAWTLQELLAPRQCCFYDQNWDEIGSRGGVAEHVQAAARIDPKWLGSDHLDECSVAMRMSWAAGRKATRVEDVAYSLLGIFDVNMPLLYGEGEGAFQRLQQRILNQIDDESIFCWYSDIPGFYGLLAPSPDNFRRSAHVRPSSQDFPRPPVTITNRGIQMTCQLIPWQLNVYLMLLHCESSFPGAILYGIYLHQSLYDGHYHRVCTGSRDIPAVHRREKEFRSGVVPHSYGAWQPEFCVRGYNSGSYRLLHTIARTITTLAPTNLHHRELKHAFRSRKGARCLVSFQRTLYSQDLLSMAETGNAVQDTFSIDDLEAGIYRSVPDSPLIDGVRIGFDLDFYPIFLFSVPFADETAPDTLLLNDSDCPVWKYDLLLIKVDEATLANEVTRWNQCKILGFRGDRLRGFEVTVRLVDPSQPCYGIYYSVSMLPVAVKSAQKVFWACHLDVKRRLELDGTPPVSVLCRPPFCQLYDNTDWGASGPAAPGSTSFPLRRMYYLKY